MHRARGRRPRCRRSARGGSWRSARSRRPRGPRRATPPTAAWSGRAAGRRSAPARRRSWSSEPGRGQRGLADVVLEVEVGSSTHSGPAGLERRDRRASGGSAARGAGAAQRVEELVERRRRALEDRRARRRACATSGPPVQERRVDRGQPVQVLLRHGLAHRDAWPRPTLPRQRRAPDACEDLAHAPRAARGRVQRRRGGARRRRACRRAARAARRSRCARGAQPSSSRARVVSMTGTREPHVDPAGRGRLQARAPGQRRAGAQHARRGPGRRARRAAPASDVAVEHRVGGDVEGAARVVVERPRGGRRRRRRRRGRPGSAAAGGAGTTGIERRGARAALGRNGPANSRRIPVAASRWKIRPGRRRTTRISGWAASKRRGSRSTAALWRE